MPDPVPPDPAGRILRAALYLLLAAIAVQLTVAVLRTVWWWLLGGLLLLGAVSAVVSYLRWRHHHW